MDFAVEKSSNNKFGFQCLECVNQHLWKRILCSLVMVYHSVAKLYIIFELRKIFAFKMKLF